MMIYVDLFLTFLKIGAFTFGGGYAMLPLIQAEVTQKEWLALEELVNFIAVSESTPGPFAVNIATYAGVEIGGFLGSLCATLGIVLPSFIVILIVANRFAKFQKSKIVNGCMFGLKPAVIGLIGSALISLGLALFFPNGFLSVSFDALFYVPLGIFILMTILTFKRVNPMLVTIFSAILGIIFGYIFNL